MSKTKATAKTTSTATTKKTAKADLSTIRGNFDGLAKKVSSLPEGQQKKSILNALEEVYLGVANAFQGFAPTPAIEA